MSYREPGRDVDMTEIERAKIHEAAETKRKQISEREATRRTRIAELGIIPWLVAGAVAFTGTIVGGFVGCEHISRTADRDAPCKESTEIINVNSSRQTCISGVLETESLKDGQVLVRCRCYVPVSKAHVADGGAQ